MRYSIMVALLASFLVSPLSAQISVGAPDNTFGPGANYTFLTDGLVFDVLAPVVLTSVNCYPNGAGNVVVNLLDNLGTTLQTVSVPVAGAGLTTIPLGFLLTPGTGFKLDANGSTTGGLFRNTSGALYPYTAPGLLSITNAFNNLAGFYYFFYNWQLGGGSIPPNWQINAPEASLDVNGTQVSSAWSLTPASTSVLVGSSATVNVDSTLTGTNHEVLAGFRPPVSANSGAYQTAGGQLVNVDLFDPLLTFVYGNGLNPSLVPFSSAYSLNVTPTAPITVAAQALFVNPAFSDGFTLSQTSELVGTNSQITSFAGDELVQSIPLLSPIVFYGQIYTSIDVSTNGFIKFGANTTTPDSAESADRFHTGLMGQGAPAPGIAVLWKNLDMGNRPTSEVRVTESLNGLIQIEYLDGDHWPATSFGSVSCTIDSSGTGGFAVSVILDYTGYTGGAALNEGIVGVSDGGTVIGGGSIPVALDLVTGTTVNLYTSVGISENIFQSFDGVGTVVAPIPAQPFDLGGLTVTFGDASGLGTWAVQ